MTDPMKENNYKNNGTSFKTGYNDRFLFVVTNLCIHMNKNTNTYSHRNIYILLSLYTENTNKTRVRTFRNVLVGKNRNYHFNSVKLGKSHFADFKTIVTPKKLFETLI